MESRALRCGVLASSSDRPVNYGFADENAVIWGDVEHFMCVEIVALSDPQRGVLVTEEIVSRADQVLTVGEIELHREAVRAFRWLRTSRFDRALMWRGMFCSSFQE